MSDANFSNNPEAAYWAGYAAGKAARRGVRQLLPPEVPIASVPGMSARLGKIMRNAGLTTVADVRALDPRRLRGLPNLGWRSVLELIELGVLAHELMDATTKPMPAPAQTWRDNSWT